MDPTICAARGDPIAENNLGALEGAIGALAAALAGSGKALSEIGQALGAPDGRSEQSEKMESALALLREVQAYAEEQGDAALEAALRSAVESVQDSRAGSVELIIGPMYSGKTEELTRRVRHAALAATPSVIVKHKSDTRYEKGAVVATHAGARQASAPETEESAPIRVVLAERLAAAELDSDELTVGVDEGQFYPDLVAQCEAWAAEGRRVIVSALDGTFARAPFGQVCDLVPLCESVTKLRGVCMACRRRPSSFSQRLGAGTAVVEIGGKESYRSVCRQCYFRKK